MKLRWYAVQTFAGAEWEAHRGLLARGIESFLPHYIDDARRGRWRHGVVRPHFPGYMFAGLVPDQEAVTVEKTTGVRELIRNSNEYVRITAEAIADLKQQAASTYNRSLGERADVRNWKVGDWCVIPYGMFMGKPAQINAIDKSGLVHASLGSIAATFHISAISAYTVRGRAAQC